MTTTINNEHKKLNVPNLRFPEFQGEWEEYTLQDVVTFSNGKAHENCVNDDGDYILVNSKFVSTNGQVQKRVTSQLSPLHKSQFVMVMSDLPNGKALAKCFYVEEDNKYTLNQRVCSFTSNDGNVSRFLMYQINRNKYYLRFDDGINQTNLKKSEVLSCPVFIPIVREQEKIATLLCKIDERIATQNKIIEDLKKLKCAIIEKLYTEIQGEEYSYGQLLEIVNERNKQMGYSNILSASQEKGMVNREDLNLDIQFEHNNISTYKIVREGDYVIHLRSFQGGFAFSDKLGVCSPAYTILRPNRLLEFGYLSYYFMSQRFIKSLIIVTYGIRDGRSINVEEWLNMKTVIPSKEHQLHILKVLRSIEGKIKNEETYATCLSNQKQYLLQQMFI